LALVFANGAFAVVDAVTQSLNDVVSMAFVSAGIPATKKPTGLATGDVKRPDGMTLATW